MGLDDPLPSALAVDTSFLLYGLNVREPLHPRARHLLDRMEAEGTVVYYCRHLLQLEFWSACAGYSKRLRRRELALLVAGAVEAWTGRRGSRGPTAPVEPLERYRFVTETFERLLEQQLAALNAVSIGLTNSALRRARQAMFRHGLRSYDAVVVVVAEEAAITSGSGRHLATMDADFAVVDDLSVWGWTPDA
jgi:predicted nucleic acid-binding protein